MQYELDQRFNTFAICARDCAAQVRNYIRKEVKSDLPIAYIFDQGDEGKGLLINEMQASNLPRPAFKRRRPDPDLDPDDPYHVQWQACDFAAWELRRGKEDLEDGKIPRELRKSLLALKTKKRIWKETKERDLQALIQVAENWETELIHSYTRRQAIADGSRRALTAICEVKSTH
jgi:hypothetical protein